MTNSDLQIYAPSSPEQAIELLRVYMEEWRYRNSLFWNQLFLLYTSALVVFVLPYMINSYIGTRKHKKID